jgi:hypothetical protein
VRNPEETALKYLVMVLALAIASLAQSSPPPVPSEPKGQAAVPVQTTPDLASQVPSPRAEDVKSVDALVRAVYEVISGPAGGRDWNRFRSLFVPQARLTKAAEAADGSATIRLLTVDDFVAIVGQAVKEESFFENPIVTRSSTYGRVAQVFSSYESRHAPGAKPFQRGINSFQLLNDGKRWWVLSILWDQERPDNPLPAEFAHDSSGKPDSSGKNDE